MDSYQKDRNWSDTYESQIREILKFNAHHILDIDVASFEQDVNNSTDYTIKFKGGDIAVRIRRPEYSKPGHIYRDLTIRALRDSGSETEFSKIRKGFGKFYLYGWTNDQHQISNWILVDLDKLRESDLLNKYEKDLIDNHDGTYFIAIPAKELEEKNILIAGIF